MSVTRRKALTVLGASAASLLTSNVFAAVTLPQAPAVQPLQVVPCQYPVIELSGTPFERGKAYGMAVKEAVRRNIVFYKMIFKTFSNISWEKAMATSKKFLPYIEKFCPGAIEEMKGVASGADLPFEEILTLNCRSEIMFAASDGCTAVAFLKEQTTGGSVLLGQTWDWFMPARENTCILKIRQEKAPDILMVAEAGLIGGKGLNSCGIGLCLNAVSIGSGKEGVPLHLIMRNILNATLPTEALDCIAHVPRAGSATLTIGSAEDLVMAVEYSPNEFDVLMAEEEPLAHTNHFLSPLIAPHDKGKAGPLSTYTRLNTVRRKIKKLGKADGLNAVYSLLTSHEFFPESLCYHEDVRDSGLRACTIYSMVMDLNSKTLLISNGHPCEGKVSEFSI
ncbi:MAG: acyl-CoA--6-aminopenicillanic acid acyl-transferase [Burkholderiales bacterium]|nr:acyl-CoA--6-aminopenicillanic acid acyl-transferase [Burkholderiales bacterium]